MSAVIAPKVSVVMGVYNGGQDLPETLRSVLDQEYPDFEFIVIDDGSTDGTGKLLRDWSAMDSRIRVEQQSNRGLTVALQRGCEIAKGDYVMRQDCGDVSLPGRLAALAQVLDTQSDVVLVASSYRHVASGGELMETVRAPTDSLAWSQSLISGDENSLVAPQHGTVMFRRRAYLAAGGYRTEFYFAQDIDLWTRLAGYGKFHWLDSVLYEVRYLRGSISAVHRARQRALVSLICDAARRRAQGLDECAILEKAKTIRPEAKGYGVGSEVDHDYFVGSCLLEKKDPAARRYLGRVLLRRPWMLKAWIKMLKTLVVIRA